MVTVSFLGYVINHSGQLSLLPSAGWEMSTGQMAVKLCGWEVEAGMWINVWMAGKTVSRVNKCHT